MDMRFIWDNNKNELLKKNRSISFEQVLISIENDQIVDVIENPNQKKYKNQIFILVKINNYIYIVPAFISESGKECHLKTIYPSRKYTEKYLRSTQ